MLAEFADRIAFGDGVIDIGANDGTWACGFAERVGDTGHVLAVEPDPVTCERAIERCRMLPQVTVLQAAVGAASGMRLLYRDPDDSRRSSLWERNVIAVGGGHIDVPVMTLDEIAGRVPNLAAIKIDAQGAEVDILRGAPETLARRLIWQLEYWPLGFVVAGSPVRALDRKSVV